MPSPNQISTVITPANSLWLVSLDAALDELGLDADGGTQDSQVGRMIGQVSAAINTHCNRIFVRQSYRDQFRYTCNWLGYGNPLMLSQCPIGVDEDGELALAASEDGAVIDTSEWEVNRNTGSLYRLNSSGTYATWSGSLVSVDYDAGFDLIPDVVQAAALRWLSMRYSARGRDPLLRSEDVPGVQRFDYFQIGGGSVGVPPEVTEMLSGYRIWSI